MTSIRLTCLFLICLLILLNPVACRSTRSLDGDGVFAGPHAHSDDTLSPGTQWLYVFRNANFSGGGRTHLLRIDGKTIGPLTPENYYRLEMWPGEYQFTIFLPRESLPGFESPPLTIGRQINLTLQPKPNASVLTYTDGKGSDGLNLKPFSQGSDFLGGRTLARTVQARETAQVTMQFDARYDGPAWQGRPHGNGTLQWPDGSRYVGLFQHGEPTRRAKFYFPGGQVFMGPNFKGRPAHWGVLMDAQGSILFAGRFEDEKPHGVGLRHGPEGPEFCIFENGRDITKTFRRRSKEALEIEDRQRIASWVDPVVRLDDEIEIRKRRLAALAARHDPDMLRSIMEEGRTHIQRLERTRKGLSRRDPRARKAAFVDQLDSTRYERELALEKVLRKQHRDRIDTERQWCREEMDQGRNLCPCAPLAEDFDDWQDCWEPQHRRYIDW